MSTNTNASDEEIPSREVAYRLFAAEYDDASLSHTESDEERAPNYVVTPTGARTNRVFVVGTLTEVADVNEEMVRARVVDPTGAFVVYAGQYQPDELAFLEQVSPPAFVAVTGKARTFEPEDGDRVYTSIRPESIATVDAETRDRWVVSAAERTLERIGTYASAATIDARGDDLADALAEAGVDRGLAAGIPLAQDHYGTTPDYLTALQACALEAVESVAGDRTEVTAPSIGPDESNPAGDASFAALSGLVDLDLDVEAELEGEVPADERDAMEPAGDAVADSSPEQVETRAGSAEPSAETTTDDPEPVATDDPEPAGDDGGPGDVPTASVETPVESTDSDEVAASDPADDSVGDATVSDSTEPTGTSEIESSVPTADEGASADSETIEFDSEADAEADPDDDLEDLGPGMYEMDDEEREQLEAEFGAEFTTGAEVDDPGDAGLETEPAAEATTDDSPATSAEPADADPLDASADSSADAGDDLETAPESTLEAGDATLDSAPESSFESTDEPETDDEIEDDELADAESDPDETADAGESDESTAADEVAEDVDLQSYVVDAMTDLDDGSGADRDELVASVVENTGASSEAVEDAIQDALMGGQCYEPDDGVLKAI
ncbi:hypothetical protein [Natrarchaeobaculum aegyptiacum]|uniref:Rpa-associated protein n=1 Tax=Natrarchaeobaculum aegyptiacum TaxID=745377 RepID=A0A2Z2HNZ2_9EURY|nr:hypothetical protein [Natrarchaeobaculum aegyptiacum]ARS88699.1 hypothetical protein B1756_02290 [Natrarchaeobaculum aegyptiacum]